MYIGVTMCSKVIASVLKCHIPHFQYAVHMRGCCTRYKNKPSPASLTTNAEWLGTTQKLFIWLPSSSPAWFFCRVRGNHLLPGDNGWPGRRGLEMGRANKIERKWQALSQNLQYLPACLAAARLPS